MRSSFVVMLALALSGCETMRAADRGLYQAAEAVTERDHVTGQRSLSLQDRQKQIELGNEVSREVISKYEKINEELDPEQFERVKRIFGRIHAVSHLRGEDWTLVLIPEESFNAFVNGGTYVFVHEGLMKQLESDDEVAAVLGHELGHVAANHVFEHATHNLAANLAKSSSVKNDRFNAAFTHEDEREADRIGILYCALAGYDPHAAGRVWKQKFEQSGNFRILPSGEVPLQDHPVYGERAAETAAIGDSVSVYYSRGVVNPDADQILKSNALWNYSEDAYAESAGKGGGALAVLSTALGAYTEHLNAKREASRQQYRSQLTKYADQNSYILEHGPVDHATWGIKFQYKGSRTLTYMVVAADFVMPGNKHIRVIGEIKGNIIPGSVHTVLFSDERLTEVDNSTAKILYTVDDAADYLTM